VRALASPAPLKGVLPPTEAAAALARGFRSGGTEATELPIGDGGSGTAEALRAARGGEWHEERVSDALGRPIQGRWLLLPDRTAVVEAAEAIGLARVAADELDPMGASSRGLGELARSALASSPKSLLVCLGDTATVDGGAGFLEIVTALTVPTRVACDVRNPLLGERGAAAVFGPQKGATPDQIGELERRLRGMAALQPFARLPGAGAAGGLGAALAALGAELVSGAELVLELVRFRDAVREADLVVTGEGTLDATTFEGKAPWAAARMCREERTRCVLFGGRIVAAPPDVETQALSGDPAHAARDLVELGARLASGGV
jgi:glycerate 2-kinase